MRAFVGMRADYSEVSDWSGLRILAHILTKSRSRLKKTNELLLISVSRIVSVFPGLHSLRTIKSKMHVPASM